MKTDNIMNFLFIKGEHYVIGLRLILSCVRCFHDDATRAIKKEAVCFK